MARILNIINGRPKSFSVVGSIKINFKITFIYIKYNKFNFDSLGSHCLFY